MKALYHSNSPKKYLWRKYHADLLKMESLKTFMSSEVKYTEIGTVRQTKTSFRGCPSFCGRRNWHGEGEIIYFNLEPS